MATKGEKKGKAPVEEKKEVTGGQGLMDDLKNKQAFKKFSFRGEDITSILSKPTDELAYFLSKSVEKCSEQDKEGDLEGSLTPDMEDS